MKDLVRVGGLLLSVAVLASCGSSPPVRFYSLEPLQIDYVRDADDAALVGLGPLRLADYLKRSQMITRDDNAEVIVDELVRWAEPLGTAIQRIVATNVDGLLDSAAVVGFPDTDTAELDFRVVGRIHRFDVTRSGTAVLEVQWRVEDADGKTITPPRRDRYEAGVSRVGDPSANAKALTTTLGQFSRAVADNVRNLTGS